MDSKGVAQSGAQTAQAVRSAPDTESKHRLISAHCASVFAGRLKRYGPSWRMLRPISVVDQIYIKARRIRRLEQLGGEGAVEDSIWEEYAGILNYCVMALWQLELGEPDLPQSLDELSLPAEWSDAAAAIARHEAVTERALRLLERKNHDYGEAWRKMAMESITDELLSRTVRMKRLLEGGERSGERLKQVESQLYDAINYAAFALIRLSEDVGEATRLPPA